MARVRRNYRRAVAWRPAVGMATITCIATITMTAPCGAQDIVQSSVAQPARWPDLMANHARNACQYHCMTPNARDAAAPAVPPLLAARILAIAHGAAHRQWPIGTNATLVVVTPRRMPSSTIAIPQSRAPEDSTRSTGLAVTTEFQISPALLFAASGVIDRSSRRLTLVPIEAHRLATMAVDLSAGVAAIDSGWFALVRWQNTTTSRRSIGMVRAAEIMGGAAPAGQGWFVDLGIAVPTTRVRTALVLTLGSANRSARDAAIAGVGPGRRDTSARATLTVGF